MIASETGGQAALAGLQELFASATHDASAAMCRWTDGIISVTLDEVKHVALEEVTTALAVDDRLQTMVVLTLDGDVGGSLILIFDEQQGRQLTASLLGRTAPGTGEWSELEQSALMETGNILGCSYVNALTRLVGIDLHPSPPCFLQDYAASVIEQSLMTQAAAGDDLLLCDIIFHRQGDRLDWRMVFVPTPGLQALLMQSFLAAQ